MSLKHLGPGSQNPPLTKGILRVYSMVFCPYAQRARLVLAAKKIEYETVNIKLNKKPEWYLELNPLGQVPCLHFDDGRVLPESLIIADYLDEVYPNKLSPSDPFKRAQHRVLVEMFSKVTSNFYKLYRNFDQAAADAVVNALEVFEKKLEGKFFGGDSPAMVDYMIWPWIERFEFIKVRDNFDLVSPTKYPKLTEYVKAMKEVPAVKETIIPPEKYIAFMQSYITDSPNYDIGLSD